MDYSNVRSKFERVQKVRDGFNICQGVGENAGECRVCPYNTGELDLSCGDVLVQDINALIEELAERIKADS